MILNSSIVSYLDNMINIYNSNIYIYIEIYDFEYQPYKKMDQSSTQPPFERWLFRLARNVDKAEDWLPLGRWHSEHQRRGETLDARLQGNGHRVLVLRVACVALLGYGWNTRDAFLLWKRICNVSSWEHKAGGIIFDDFGQRFSLCILSFFSTLHI